MDKIILMIEAEDYQDRAKALPAPLCVFGLCLDDNPDVLLVYEDLERSSARTQPALATTQ